MEYFILRDEKQTGPHTLEVIQAGLANGDFSTGDLVWKEGMPDWLPVSNVIPPPIRQTPPPVPGMPPVPTQLSSSGISSAPVDPLAGNTFLLASLDASSKDHWDVINVETGKVVICIREGERGFADSVIKGGLLDAWGGRGISKFNVALLDPSGPAYLVLRGGGIGGHSEAYSPNGEKIGDVKRTSLINLHFEAFASEGVLFKLTAKGLGKLTSEQKITGVDGSQFGTVSDSGWSDAKETLGDKIRMVDSDRLFGSKYSYKHKVELNKEFPAKFKVFLFAAVFQLAHAAS